MSLISGSGAFNFGRSKTKSQANAESLQSIFGPQANALGSMYGSAADAYGDSSAIADKLKEMSPELSSLLSGYASDASGAYKNQLSGGSLGDTRDIRSLLSTSFARQQGGSNMGDMYKSIVGGPGNTYIDPMVDRMKRSAGENLGMMRSGTGLDASEMGQSGSSRHAMQNAMQAKQLNNDMLDREMTMRGGAYDTDLDRKLQIAQQADTNQLQTQRNMMETLGMSDANKQAGMNFGTNMQNLGMGSMAPWMQAMMAPWMNMQGYAGALGDPTVLTNAKSNAYSSGKSMNLGMSASGGFM